MLTKIDNSRAFADLNKCILILELLKIGPRTYEDLQVYFSTDIVITLNLDDTLNLLVSLGYLKKSHEKEILSYELLFEKINTTELIKKIFDFLLTSSGCSIQRIEKIIYIKIEQRFFAIRNQLILGDVISKSELNNLYKLNSEYHKHISGFGGLVSKEQFMKQLQMQNVIGERAETYVLEIENKRLNYMKELNHTALTDNNAGYDIASYLDIDSIEYNKFIEVKCYSSRKDKFFVSKNEQNKSEKLKNNYFLYLVDSKFEHEPIVIQNPFTKIFNNESIEYEEESRSYKISQIIKELEG